MKGSKILFIATKSVSNEKITNSLIEAGHECNILFSEYGIKEEIANFQPEIIMIDRAADGDTFYSMMKLLGGYTEIRNIPKLVLLSKNDFVDTMHRYETDIDDYLEKPIDYKILNIRVRVIQKWIRQKRGLNPVSGLKGNDFIDKMIYTLNKRSQHFAALYFHLPNIEHYADRYGAVEADKILIELTTIVERAYAKLSGAKGELLAHIEGASIMSICALEEYKRIANFVIFEFDEMIRSYYLKNERKLRSYNAKIKFPDDISNRVTVSVLVATTEKRHYRILEDVMRIIRQLLKVKKTKPGSELIVDKRSDKGTKFSAKKHDTEKRALGKRASILIVDRDPRIRKSLTEFFTLKKFTSKTATSIGAALSILYEERFDIIISEMVFEDGNGFEMLRRLKSIESLKNIPLTFYSEHSKKEIILEALKGGAARYFIKPMKTQELFKKVYEVLVSV